MSWDDSFTQATRAFRLLAGRMGRLEQLALGGTGPEGESLSLDVALIGPEDAERCVIVSAGLHGVEGIAGSAVLRAWLAGAVSAGQRIVLLHLLNPYGFAWGRRADRDNIDLNRNFLLEGEVYRGHAPGWDRVATLLSPPRPASRWMPLLPTLLLLVAREGYRGLSQAIAGGQYSHPQAIFYGGAEPSELQRLLAQHLPRWTAGARDVLHLDIHTGLGRPGQLQLLLPRTGGSAEAQALQLRFGSEAIAARSEPRHFRTRGSLGPWCEALLPDTHYTLCTAEFGTRPALSVLAALYHENRAHFWNARESRSARWARARLRNVFAVPDEAWRARVIARGTGLIDQALAS